MLFTQLNPARCLFATGDLRDIVAPHELGRMRRQILSPPSEAFASGANLLAVALWFGARVRLATGYGLVRGPGRVALA